MKKKIGADEYDAVFALIFFLTPVNIYLPFMFYFLKLFVMKLLKRGIQIDENLTSGRPIEALKL